MVSRIISDALGLDVSDVFWKRRSRQKGLNQYENLATRRVGTKSSKMAIDFGSTFATT